MSRLIRIAPLFFAISLGAQIPAVPPKAPPARPFNVDRAWADELAASARSMANNFSYTLDYNLATELRLDALNSISYAFSDLSSFGGTWASSWRDSRPVAWAQGDPADSLYKQARDQFSRGDYRRAADAFKSIPVKFPSSAYVADAQYWQAFWLYRIGGTPELQQALVVLEARKPAPEDTRGRRPASGGIGSGVGGGTSSGSNGTTVYTTSNAHSYSFGQGSRVDAAGLAARIANVLSQRGLANDPAVKRALAAGGNSCDQDDQSVRAEALSALMQNDAETGRQMAVKILANKDECSVPLRRNAVMLVGNRKDDAATATLIPVAKSDPSQGVRVAALDYLVRVQTDAAITAVMDIARSDTSKQIQRSALRGLAQSPNARARAEVRSVVENNAADESMRISVIDGLDRDRITAEDAAWLRTLYGKTTSTRMKDRIISAVGRAGGDANTAWIQTLLRNEDESLESRSAALEHVGRAMDVAALIKTYDASAQRPIRETVIRLLSERKEPEALDKILDIAKNGTDTRMRTQAINYLSRSKDPRAIKALLDLIH